MVPPRLGRRAHAGQPALTFEQTHGLSRQFLSDRTRVNAGVRASQVRPLTSERVLAYLDSPRKKRYDDDSDDDDAYASARSA